MNRMLTWFDTLESSYLMACDNRPRILWPFIWLGYKIASFTFIWLLFALAVLFVYEGARAWWVWLFAPTKRNSVLKDWYP